MSVNTSSPAAAVARLVEVVNRHDLERLGQCFAEDFVNETPNHPSRSFVGSAQVVRNWGQIFAAVPDLRVEAVRWTGGDQTAWIEWEMKGTRADGKAHLMRGVTIFGLDGDRFGWVRFYLEPVEAGGPAIDQAVREQLSR